MTIITQDISFVKGLLPDHYIVKESKKAGSVHCVSSTGMRKNTDADDDEAFGVFFNTVKSHFGDRFQEIFHNVCAWHSDFTIFLKAA